VTETLRNVEGLARSRLKRWRRTTVGRVDVFLGWKRRISVVLVAVLAVLVGVHGRATRFTFGPWLWLAVLGDLVMMAALVRYAVRHPTYLTITRRELIARTRLRGAMRWSTRAISAITLSSERHRLVQPPFVRTVFTHTIDVTTGDGTVRIAVCYDDEMKELLRTLASVTGVAPTTADSTTPPTREPLTTVSDAWAVQVRLRQQLGYMLVVIVMLALGFLGSIVTGADRSPVGSVVAADVVQTNLARAGRALAPVPRIDDDGSVRQEIERCHGSRPLVRAEPEAWAITVRADRQIAYDLVWSEWWRDTVRSSFESNDATIDDGYDVDVRTTGDSIAVVLTSDCIVGSTEERAQIVTTMTELSRDAVAVAPPPTTLADIAAVVRSDAAMLFDPVDDAEQVRSSVEFSACAVTSGRPPAWRTETTATLDVAVVGFDGYVTYVARLFGSETLLLAVRGYSRDQYSVTLTYSPGTDPDSGVVTATIATECAIGDDRGRAELSGAVTDLARRLLLGVPTWTSP
jgi:hypothetical protein